MVLFRHRKNFRAFTGQSWDIGLILLILNMILHKNFTGPTHFLSANVRGPVSFAVSDCYLVFFSLTVTSLEPSLINMILFGHWFVGLLWVLSYHRRSWKTHLQNYLCKAIDATGNPSPNLKIFMFIAHLWSHGIPSSRFLIWSHRHL